MIFYFTMKKDHEFKVIINRNEREFNNREIKNKHIISFLVIWCKKSITYSKKLSGKQSTLKVNLLLYGLLLCF